MQKRSLFLSTVEVEPKRDAVLQEESPSLQILRGWVR
jgi:hypothetical protein